MMWKIIQYKIFGNCWYYTNKKIHLIVTLDCGPRIIFFGSDLKHNVLFEDLNDYFNMKSNAFKKIFGKKAIWHIYGGHRLWTTPETLYTYEPDNDKIIFKEINGNTFEFTQPPKKINKLQFILRIAIVSNRILIEHIIINLSKNIKNLAPWSVTTLAANGTAAFKTNQNDTGFLPNRKLVLWPYTRLNDPRLFFDKKYISLKMNPKIKNPLKIGVDNECGKASYYLKPFLLTIESKYLINGTYPDKGSSFEFYTNEHFLEIETLGLITKLKPNDKIIHCERWTLQKIVKAPLNN